MQGAKRPRPLLLFYVLVVYVFIQFGWWTFLLVRLNNDVIILEKQVLVEQAQAEPPAVDSIQLEQKEKDLKAKLHKQWMMIFGEGSVFLVLLLLGILRTRNSFKKEVALSNQQKNFLLSVTHELKSPLASVRLQLETIHKRDLPKEKREEMLLNAIEDTDRLNALVENILVAARINNHQHSLHQEKGNLSIEVSALLEKAKNGFARHHQIIANIEENIFCSFDRIGFHSIFINIMENAAKYSKAGTEISISLKKTNDDILLSVGDQGPGISDVEKQNVFGRFYRIGNEETRTTKGTGLGLYIVQSLISAQGWKIRIVDQPQSGSIIEITIPNS